MTVCIKLYNKYLISIPIGTLAETLKNKERARVFAEEKLEAYLPPIVKERWLIKMVICNLSNYFLKTFIY
jgi:hypothetical protein